MTDNVRRRIVLAFCVGLQLVLFAVPAHAQRLVLLVRHAERADGGSAAGGMAKETDPPLSASGEARAAKLAAMLADAGVHAIFSTKYRRTQDTVKPLSQKIGVPVTVVPGNDAQALAARLRASHANDVVLISGHSNTIPDIVKALGGPAISIADSEYDNLFVLVPATGTLTRIRY